MSATPEEATKAWKNIQAFLTTTYIEHIYS